MRHFLPMWESITTDQWVLDIVRWGYPLPFVTMPQLTLTTKPAPHDPVRRTVLRQEFQALLDNHAVMLWDLATHTEPQEAERVYSVR